MSNPVALITGGAKGIGRATALQLAADGWSIALCYRVSAAAAEETGAAIREQGTTALVAQCDVSDRDACDALVRRVQDAFGRIDALINCAGAFRRQGLLEETVEGWHDMFDGNLHPVFYLSRLVAPQMIAQRSGRIVNIGTAVADRLSAQPGMTAHYIAKAGVLMLTRALAKSLGPYNITSNAVSPGCIDSGSNSAEALQQMARQIPAGRAGQTADVVSAIRFLLSNDARYVNGANLHVSGGWGL